jgi:hypothetical protein
MKVRKLHHDTSQFDKSFPKVPRNRNLQYALRSTGWRRETGKFEVDVGSLVDVQ